MKSEKSVWEIRPNLETNMAGLHQGIFPIKLQMLQNVCEYGLVQSMSKFPEVVVLAGGVGKRFRQADPDSPEKPLIQVFGASQIVWALLGVIHSYPSSKIYIASRSGLIDSLRKEGHVSSPDLDLNYDDMFPTSSEDIEAADFLQNLRQRGRSLS